MTHNDEYFGTPAHLALQKRSRDVWQLLKDDPRYGSYGRNVLVIGDQGDASLENMTSIARLTGAAGTHFYPTEKSASLVSALTDRGFTVGRWENCIGRQG